MEAPGIGETLASIGQRCLRTLGWMVNRSGCLANGHDLHLGDWDKACEKVRRAGGTSRDLPPIQCRRCGVTWWKSEDGRFIPLTH